MAVVTFFWGLLMVLAGAYAIATARASADWQARISGQLPSLRSLRFFGKAWTMWTQRVIGASLFIIGVYCLVLAVLTLTGFVKR